MESDGKEPPPINTPPIPRRPTMENVGTSKQRFSKSRNGCVTCKARRVKCDETKPTCEQCARRRITCGGYKIDVRWKQAAEPKKQNAPKRNRGNSSSQAERPIFANDTSPTGRQNTSSAGFNDNSSRSDQPRLPYSTGSEEMMNLDFMGSSTNATSMDLPTPHTLNLIFSGLDQDILTSLPPNQQAMHSANASPDTVDSNGNTNVVDYASELWNMDTFWEDYLKPLPTTPIVFEAEASHQRTIPETPREREDEAERIAFLFHQQTCHTLSIDEETDRNPWRNLIWPLAKDHPALYEAIAALTCFCMSKEQPQLRNEGTRHIHRSVQMLAESMQNERIPVDVALATTLALAFAETCNCDSSIGLNHMRAGGVLLQQLLANQANVLLDEEIKARSEFLGRTWTYMDVLARFTCPELSLQGPAPEGFNWEALGDDHSRLDPLMGYSTTFFPIMRRVADLINKVRAREQSRNSPAIISQALELRRSIERWTPPIDLEVIDDPSQNMTDAIQTAEAFRWSTLLMLYQAVPELPNLTSYGELAQKILVYLATIPTSSTTIIVHIFPLLVAGCDAVEEEDRDFVRERWNIMSQRMVTGVVERCLKITEELWRRREEYLLQRGLSFNSTGSRIATNLNEQSALSNDIATFINAETSPGAATTSSGGQSNYRSIRKGNDFPISAAFKRGVDILTRSGSTEYTVRGRLHWLGVVKDWNWNFMLA